MAATLIDAVVMEIRMKRWCLPVTNRLMPGATSRGKTSRGKTSRGKGFRMALAWAFMSASPTAVWAQIAPPPPAAEAAGDLMSNTQRGFGWALAFFFLAIVVGLLTKSANRDDRPKKLDAH